jgi:hypothetical protein
METNTLQWKSARHVALRLRGIHVGFWWENQKKRDHWEDQEVGRWIILKWILRQEGLV